MCLQTLHNKQFMKMIFDDGLTDIKQRRRKKGTCQERQGRGRLWKCFASKEYVKKKRSGKMSASIYQSINVCVVTKTLFFVDNTHIYCT